MPNSFAAHKEKCLAYLPLQRLISTCAASFHHSSISFMFQLVFTLAGIGRVGCQCWSIVVSAKIVSVTLEIKCISTVPTFCKSRILLFFFNKMIDLHFYIKRLRNFMSWYWKVRWFQSTLWYQSLSKSPNVDWFELLEKFQYKAQKIQQFVSEVKFGRKMSGYVELSSEAL